MKVIMSTDAIHRPLTGIGRYAFELYRGLNAHPKITMLKAFAHGRWVADPLAVPDSSQALPKRKSLRQTLALLPPAVWAYSRVIPPLSGWRLRRHEDALFYSPNYILPPAPAKMVATFHDMSVHDHPEFHPKARVAFIKHELPKTLRRADALIVDSDFTKDRVLAHFNWPEDRIHVVRLGVDHGSFRVLKETGEDHVLRAFGLRRGHYTLCISTIEPRKNMDRLLAAYRLLPTSVRASCPLVLVGDRGWRSEATHAAMQTASEEGWLKSVGYLPEDQLVALTAHCALFVFPSLYEGFGLPVLEAMACGVPVLSANLPSVREFAKDSIRYMQAGSLESMAQSLEATLTDSEWLNEAGARAEAESRPWTWQKTVDQTVQVLEMVSDKSESLVPLGQIGG